MCRASHHLAVVLPSAHYRTLFVALELPDVDHEVVGAEASGGFSAVQCIERSVICGFADRHSVVRFVTAVQLDIIALGRRVVVRVPKPEAVIVQVVDLECIGRVAHRKRYNTERKSSALTTLPV